MTEEMKTETEAKYAAPKLEVYGEMATLTAGGTSGRRENRPAQSRRRA